MNEIIGNYFHIFFAPFSLAIVLVYLFGFIAQKVNGFWTQRIAIGLIFGVAAVYAMSEPIVMAEGIIIDLRNLLIALAAAFFGVLSGSITLTIAVIARMMIGGIGTIAGIGGMLIAIIGGLFWANFLRPRIGSDFISLLALGGIVSISTLSALVLPAPIRNDFLLNVAPIVSLLYVIGSLIIGSMLMREKELQQKQTQLERAATTDPLTNLHNRRSVEKAYGHLTERRRSASGTAMLCIDIDHFKAINDTYGHLCGDALLVAVTQRISSCLRPTDIFSRLGGDEFMVLLPDVSEPEIGQIAARCCDAVNEAAMSAYGVEIAVTISVGANWSRNHHAFDPFFAAADAALYKAKAMGRNRAFVANRSAGRPSLDLAS